MQLRVLYKMLDWLTKSSVQRTYEQVILDEKSDRQSCVSAAWALQDQFVNAGIPLQLARVASAQVVDQSCRIQALWGLSFDKSLEEVVQDYGRVIGRDIDGIHLMAIASHNGMRFTRMNEDGEVVPDDHRKMIGWLISLRESAEELMPTRSVGMVRREQWLMLYMASVLESMGKLGGQNRRLLQENSNLVWLAIRFWDDTSQDHFVKCLRVVLRSHTDGFVEMLDKSSWDALRFHGGVRERSVVYDAMSRDASDILELYERGGASNRQGRVIQLERASK